MSTSAIEQPPAIHPSPSVDAIAARQRVVAYFNASNEDYGAWSKNHDMHFGYWKRGVPFWKLHRLLSQMSLEVFARLRITTDQPCRVLDLGGGVGASARTIAAHAPMARIDVVTAVQSQVTLGEELCAAAGQTSRIKFIEADYTATGLPSASYDGIWALESACQSPDSAKLALLREAYRLLKPGGYLVIADGALRGAPPVGLTSKIFRRWCRAWAVEDLMRLDQIPAALAEVGFEHIATEDWSWRVVPSLLHVPYRLARFAIQKGLGLRKFGKRRWGHLVGSLLSLPLAMRLDKFAYAAVIARK